MSVLIRPWRESDAETLFEAARESWATVGPWLPWCHEGYSRDEAREWVETQAAAFREGRRYEFAIVSSEERLLGGCGLNALEAREGTANLGYWVRPSERGRGVAPAAVALVVRWAREHTALARIEVLVPASNQASLRVAVKSGATEEGVSPRRLPLHGVRHDAVVFSISLRGGI